MLAEISNICHKYLKLNKIINWSFYIVLVNNWLRNKLFQGFIRDKVKQQVQINLKNKFK